jgi:hypothetical protein
MCGTGVELQEVVAKQRRRGSYAASLYLARSCS